MQNCLFLYMSVTSTMPGMGLGGAWTRIAFGVINCIDRKTNHFKLYRLPILMSQEGGEDKGHRSETDTSNTSKRLLKIQLL